MSTDDMGEALHHEGAARDLTCSAVHPPLFSSRGDHLGPSGEEAAAWSDGLARLERAAAARQHDGDHLGPSGSSPYEVLAQYDAQAQARIERAAHARAVRRRKADERMAAELRTRGWVVQAPPAGQ